MTPTGERTPRRAAAAWTVIPGAGILAGTLDIAYACVFWWLKAGVAPQRILQSVAAGLLGPAAFEGGHQTALLGLGLQFVIATPMAAAYFFAARRWDLLRTRPVASGAAYGLLLYVVMNHVVVPLSAASPGATDALWVGLTIVAHVVLVGVPIALLCARAINRPAST